MTDVHVVIALIPWWQLCEALLGSIIVGICLGAIKEFLGSLVVEMLWD
jgi:hypothetical protein